MVSREYKELSFLTENKNGAKVSDDGTLDLCQYRKMVAKEERYD